MAGKDFGGKITVRGSLGFILSLRGTVNVSAAHQSNAAITNQDGRVDRVITPDAPTSEIVFADDGLNYDTLLNANRQNISIVEEKTGVSHLFTGAFFTGKPMANRLNGELTALGIVADRYTKVG